MSVSTPRVDRPGRCLVAGDGSPFTWLADTAWELFHRLGWTEVEHYFSVRAAQGFTAYQAVAIPEFDGLTVTNVNGDLPLHDQDPTRPNEAWFRHIDRVIARGAEAGLLCGLLPTWGDKWNQAWGKGPEIFTPENARSYGRFLGTRYRHAPVLWILGGDRPVVDERHRAIIDAMAASIRDGGAEQPMTFHPMGGSCSWEHIDRAAWCDIHQWQSGHMLHKPSADRYADRGWTATTAPLWDGEPIYEGHPRMLARWNDHRGHYDGSEVRHQAWLSALAGSCGHVYGHHAVWQFFEPGRREPINKPIAPWSEAIHAEGARQLRHLRWFLEHRPLSGRQPAQALIKRDDATNVGIRILLNADAGWAAVYTRYGEEFRADWSALGDGKLRAWWYNPRTGTAEGVRTFDAGDDVNCVPPYSDDWLLVVDRVERNLPMPTVWR